MDIIGVIENIESRINNYWNFYTIIIFANAGWIFSDYGDIDLNTAILLSSGLLLFFISNLSFQRAALNSLSAARNDLLANKDMNRYKYLLENYGKETIPYRVIGTYVLHITVDVILIITIFLSAK